MINLGAITNLLGQLNNATNQVQALGQVLNPEQNKFLQAFQKQDKNKQAQIIADLCNQHGISKNQLAQIINKIGK